MPVSAAGDSVASRLRRPADAACVPPPAMASGAAARRRVGDDGGGFLPRTWACSSLGITPRVPAVEREHLGGVEQPARVEDAADAHLLAEVGRR